MARRVEGTKNALFFRPVGQSQARNRIIDVSLRNCIQQMHQPCKMNLKFALCVELPIPIKSNAELAALAVAINRQRQVADRPIRKNKCL